jgi:hypothetical protein
MLNKNNYLLYFRQNRKLTKYITHKRTKAFFKKHHSARTLKCIPSCHKYGHYAKKPTVLTFNSAPTRNILRNILPPFKKIPSFQHPKPHFHDSIFINLYSIASWYGYGTHIHTCTYNILKTIKITQQ